MTRRTCKRSILWSIQTGKYQLTTQIFNLNLPSIRFSYTHTLRKMLQCLPKVVKYFSPEDRKSYSFVLLKVSHTKISSCIQVS